MVAGGFYPAGCRSAPPRRALGPFSLLTVLCAPVAASAGCGALVRKLKTKNKLGERFLERNQEENEMSALCSLGKEAGARGLQAGRESGGSRRRFRGRQLGAGRSSPY